MFFSPIEFTIHGFICCRNNGIWYVDDVRLVIVITSPPCDNFNNFQIYFSLQIRILSGCKLVKRLLFGRCICKCYPDSLLNL